MNAKPKRLQQASASQKPFYAVAIRATLQSGGPRERQQQHSGTAKEQKKSKRQKRQTCEKEDNMMSSQDIRNSVGIYACMQRKPCVGGQAVTLFASTDYYRQYGTPLGLMTYSIYALSFLILQAANVLPLAQPPRPENLSMCRCASEGDIAGTWHDDPSWVGQKESCAPQKCACTSHYLATPSGFSSGLRVSQLDGG